MTAGGDTVESAVLAFGSLLLGFVTGTWPITLLVAPPVETVRLELDDKVVAILEAPVFEAPVDFGDSLEPHRLDAVGLDAAGHEIARIRQWVNLPRPEAEVEVLLERGDSGDVTAARISWATVKPMKPKTVRTFLDGRVMPVAAPDRVVMPAVDLDSTHVFRVEIDFGDELVASREVVFGGPWIDGTGTELTAIPVTHPLLHRPDSASDFAGAVTVDGRVAGIAAVDRPPARIVVVRDVRTCETLLTVPAGRMRRWVMAGVPRGEDSLGFMSTRPDIFATATGLTQLFTLKLSPGVDADYALAGIIAWPVVVIDPEEQLLTDAVAAAGLAAAAGGQRRAVVFVSSGAPSMRGEIGAAQARHLLEALHVPLRVWSTDRAAVPGLREVWGDVEDISRSELLSIAGRELRRTVNRQVIVWLEGEHLPQRIGLDQSKTECRLAR